MLLFLRKPGLLVGLLAAGPVAAQVPAEIHNPAVDTIRPPQAKHYYPVTELGTVGGQHLYVFLSHINEGGRGLVFTYRDPQTIPRPRPVFASSEQLQWVRLDGAYCEPVRMAGKKPHDLVPRLAAGPRVELFDLAVGKKGIPIPIPLPTGGGMVFWTGMFSDKYNHTYYLRRPGEKLMVEVPDGKKAMPFLAQYFADAPGLAEAIRLGAGAEGYRPADVPALITRYNAWPPAGGK